MTFVCESKWRTTSQAKLSSKNSSDRRALRTFGGFYHAAYLLKERCSVPKTLSQMKKRLEEAMSQANDAEEIIPLLKKVIAQYDLIPSDLFDQSHQAPKLATPKHPKTPIARPQVQAGYRDGNGNTWAGRGRRPTWLNEALERGYTLENFKVPSNRVSRAK